MEGIIVIAVVAIFVYIAIVGPEKQIDGAMKRARERRQKELLRLGLQPRWTDEQLAHIHPESVIVFAAAQRIGDT